MKVVKEELVPVTNAKKILDGMAKDKEMGYEQNNALEHLKKFSKLSEKKTKDMLEDLSKITRLKERHRILIVNNLPESLDDLRAVLAHEIINIQEDDKKKILSIVKKFA